VGRWGLLALALLYVAIVVRLAPPELTGDEQNYLQLASNLTHGYFSPPGEVQLWYGPGYPALLAPFVALQVPVLGLRLLNVAIAIAAVWLTYGVARHYVRTRWAVAAAAYVAIYVPMLELLPRLLTEWVAATLLIGWAYCFSRLHQARRADPWLAGGAAALALLALTKALFGYVILAGLIASAVIWLISRTAAVRRWIAMYALALLLCVPYLGYTYLLTGNLFYWGSQGGLSLYWMATPYSGELGDWHSFEQTDADPRLNDAHRVFFEQVERLPEPVRDAALRQQALTNIAAHPTKYLENWLANLGRLVLDVPYSFASPGRAALVNGLFHLALLGVVVAALAARKRPTPAALGILLLFAIAFGGSSLVSAYVRQFAILAPLLLLGAIALGAG
jgi:Dolichyl-phosphate-mannose-protein mannosyltransferase